MKIDSLLKEYYRIRISRLPRTDSALPSPAGSGIDRTPFRLSWSDVTGLVILVGMLLHLLMTGTVFSPGSLAPFIATLF